MNATEKLAYQAALRLPAMQKSLEEIAKSLATITDLLDRAVAEQVRAANIRDFEARK